MSKRKKNSFEKICDQLEENYILEENQITYTRKYLKSELNVGEDKDMILKIKAEAEDSDYYSFVTTIFSMLAVFFSAMSVIINLSENDTILKIIYLIAVIIVLILALRMFGGRYNAVNKWRKYVLVVVNQLIEQQSETKFDKKAKKFNKKKQKGKK